MKIFIVFICQLLILDGWAQSVVVPFKTKEGKWRLVKKYTTTQVMGDYDGIDYLHEGIYQVWKDYKVGLVDSSGNQLLPMGYKPLPNIVKFSNGMYPLEKDGKITWFTNKGTVAYEWPFTLPPLLMVYYVKGLLNTHYGYVDKKGTVIIKPYPYRDIDGFSNNGLSRVGFEKSRKDKNGNIEVEWGVIDTTGKVIVPLKYELVDIKDEFVMASNLIKGGYEQYDCFTVNGVKFLSGTFNDLSIYYKTGMYSYLIDTIRYKHSLKTLKDNKEISDHYKSMRDFPGSRLLAYSDSGTFLIGRNGAVTKLFAQQMRIDADDFGRYVIKNDNRTCVYDSSDHELFCFTGDTILRMNYPTDLIGGFKIYDIKAKKEGYINNKGEMLVACIYDTVWYYPELGLWLVKDGDLYYYTDEKGNRYIE